MISYVPDVMVFNPQDTGGFVNSSIIIDGCDNTFVDTIVNRRLGVLINYNTTIQVRQMFI